MPPKVQKCSVCGTIDSTKWYFLDRRSICSDCHDVQLNPPLEPAYHRSPERYVVIGNREATHDAPLGDEHFPAQEETEGVHRMRQNYDTPTKADPVKQTTSEDLESGPFANHGTVDDLEEANETIAALGMFSPRRLRRRICPVRTPVLRGSKKPNRACYSSKAKSRRALVKKLPTKSPRETASTKSVPKLLHENTWYQIGDIVSMIDVKDNTYYAQIRGLMVDAYNEKSAVLTWLIPTTASPPPNERFDPATYLVGPEEDVARRLTFLSFVMHAPSNYYFDRNNPYPRPDSYGPINTTQRDNRNYVWASVAHLH